MLIRLTGGEVVDPVNGATAKRDVWIRDGLLVDAPKGATADETHDVSGCIVMAGAIDIHSHIGGGNVNTARLLLPEHHARALPRPAKTPLSNAGWSTFETGCALCADGLHHRRRAGDGAVCRSACPSRTRRHPDHRQGDTRDPRQ